MSYGQTKFREICITMSSIGSMYEYPIVDFLTDFIFHMLLDSFDMKSSMFYFHHEKCLLIRVM